MTDKLKITEILKAYTKKNNISASSVILEEYAEELVRQGAILPPCKVGDKLYIVADVSKAIVESVVMGVWIIEDSISILTIHGVIINDSFGKTVFLTKEEAEQALEGMNNA